MVATRRALLPSSNTVLEIYGIKGQRASGRWDFLEVDPRDISQSSIGGLNFDGVALIVREHGVVFAAFEGGNELQGKRLLGIGGHRDVADSWAADAPVGRSRNGRGARRSTTLRSRRWSEKWSGNA